MRIKTKLSSVTVGIPAHNEEKNIGQLLRDILNQKQTSFVLQKVLVVCDGCNDSTELIVDQMHRLDSRIVKIVHRKNLGKTASLNQIYQINQSDYLVTFDADVELGSTHEIEYLVQKIKSKKQNVVVGANLVPIKPSGLLPNIIYTNHILWNQVRHNLPNIDHIANLYGAATIIKKSFSKTVHYPTNITGDEEYLYMMAKAQNGFDYAAQTSIYYLLPQTWQDVMLQGNRFRQERHELLPYFGPQIIDQHYIPFSVKIKAVIQMLKRYPFSTPLVIFLNLYLQIRPQPEKLNQLGLWTQAKSTK